MTQNNSQQTKAQRAAEAISYIPEPIVALLRSHLHQLAKTMIDEIPNRLALRIKQRRGELQSKLISAALEAMNKVLVEESLIDEEMTQP